MPTAVPIVGTGRVHVLSSIRARTEAGPPLSQPMAMLPVHAEVVADHPAQQAGARKTPLEGLSSPVMTLGTVMMAMATPAFSALSAPSSRPACSLA